MTINLPEVPWRNLSEERTWSDRNRIEPVLTDSDERSDVIKSLEEKAYRDAYALEFITAGVPFQVRANRKAREWTQKELGRHTREQPIASQGYEREADHAGDEHPHQAGQRIARKDPPSRPSAGRHESGAGRANAKTSKNDERRGEKQR